MKKFWIGLVIILVILIGAYYFWMGKAPQTTQPAAGTSQQTATSSVIGTGSSLSLGTYLVADNGMTLYVFNNDKPNVSNCVDVCASNWPPYAVASMTSYTAGTGISGMLGTITRADGSLQLTYNSKPLYFWHGDSKTGDTTGNGFNNLWFVAKP